MPITVNEKEYLVTDVSGDRARSEAALLPPFGLGLTGPDLTRVERFAVLGSRFSTEGDDYCVFRAYDRAGAMIVERRVEGY